jgi:hypothetical protein
MHAGQDPHETHSAQEWPTLVGRGVVSKTFWQGRYTDDDSVSRNEVALDRKRAIRVFPTGRTMDRDRLNLLFLSAFPAGPPTFGAQRRVQGLMAALARRHEITGVSLITAEYDSRAAERAMREYCHEVVLVPARSWGDRHFKWPSVTSPPRSASLLLRDPFSVGCTPPCARGAQGVLRA